MGGTKQPKPVWVSPLWKRAVVKTADTSLLCFGLGCQLPNHSIDVGQHYTLHRVCASGAYVNRAFCTSCYPVRQMPPGFDPWQEWRTTMYHYDEAWYKNGGTGVVFGNLFAILDGPDKGIFTK